MVKAEKMTITRMNGNSLELEGIIGEDRRINVPVRAKKVPLDKPVRVTIDWKTQ